METASHVLSTADAVALTPVICPEPVSAAGVETPVVNLSDRSEATCYFKAMRERIRSYSMQLVEGTGRGEASVRIEAASSLR